MVERGKWVVPELLELGVFGVALTDHSFKREPELVISVWNYAKSGPPLEFPPPPISPSIQNVTLVFFLLWGIRTPSLEGEGGGRKGNPWTKRSIF